MQLRNLNFEFNTIDFADKTEVVATIKESVTVLVDKDSMTDHELMKKAVKELERKVYGDVLDKLNELVSTIKEHGRTDGSASELEKSIEKSNSLIEDIEKQTTFQ